ncbi:MAG: LPP20 family lipoprotein [Bacteroidota bacterium]|nr:LPP20 family lipoprotein [Bacteroidota bacterium]
MKKISTLVLVLMAAATSSAQIPIWFSSHNHPQYPTSEYIIGIGTGGGATGAESAKKAALADIVSQLRVQVQSEVRSVTQNFSVNDDEQIYSDFKRQSRTVVSDEITGADVIETVVDEASSTTYALVVLNRDKYSQGLRSELESGWKQASDLRTAAKEFAAKGKLNEAIQSTNQIKQVITPLFAKQVLHNAAARAPFSFPSMFNPAALQTDIRTFLSQIKLEKKSGDNQKGKIGEKFPQPFTVAVTVNDVPCSGVTVMFLLDEKNKLGEGLTDEKGAATFATSVRSGNRMKAKVSIVSIGREFDENLNQSSVTFSWTAQLSDKAFSILTNSKNKKVADNISSKLSTAVSQIGYKVVTMSNNSIIVELSTSGLNKIDGMAGTLYTLTLEATMNLKDNTSNSIGGSIQFSAKGVGKSEDEAMEKAASALKIDQKELSELLQK